MLLSRKRIIEIYKEYGTYVSLNDVFNQWLRSVESDISTTVKIALDRDDLGSTHVKKKLAHLIRRRDRLHRLIDTTDVDVLFDSLY